MISAEKLFPIFFNFHSCILSYVFHHCTSLCNLLCISSHNFSAFIFVQVIIKDSSIVLTLAHIKAYMLQTFLGLEYLHAHWILHRVREHSETPSIDKYMHSAIVV